MHNMKLHLAILCSIFLLEYIFSSLALTTTDKETLQKEVNSSIVSVETPKTQLAPVGDSQLKYDIKMTRTKNTPHRDIPKEMIEEAKKDSEQRKNSIINEPRERKITNTDNKHLPDPKVNENLNKLSTSTSATTTAATNAISSPLTNSNLPPKHDIVAEGLAMNDTQAGNFTTNLTHINGQSTISGARSSTAPATQVSNANATNNSTQSLNRTTTKSTVKTTPEPIRSSTSGTTTTTTAKTTTKTTTPTKTPLNFSKPKITYSMDTFPEWEEAILAKQPSKKPEQLLFTASTSSLTSAGSKVTSTASTIVNKPSQYEPPHTQPSQEQTSSAWSAGPNNDYIVPIFTVLVTVPLAIGVFMIMYRRIREFWSTRHYHRMDFLVDGMYND